MPCSLMNALACVLLAAEPGGTVSLHYSGELVSDARDQRGTVVKEFDVDVVLRTDAPGRTTSVFLVDELSGSSVAWPERFGKIETSTDSETAAGPVVRVLYRHRESPHLLAVRVPVFPATTRLGEGAVWSDATGNYEVIRRRNIDDRDCWSVRTSPPRGRETVLDVEAGSGLIVSGTRKLTMGQGEPFELRWRLVRESEFSGDAATRAWAVADSLLVLQAQLARENMADSPLLTPEQLDACDAAVPEIRALAADTPFARFATLIERDVQAQRQRAMSVAELAERYVGRPAPEFGLVDLNGEAISAERLAGKTVVLHFWDYRNEAFREPYGQVGYLDFLMTRHQARGLVVIGVAANPQLRNVDGAGAAIRSARKLKSFMNLGYDIAADSDGKVLKAFGDPTRFDAALPLWVVIGPDGNVAHYKTGYYEIDRERGLKELDEVVSNLAPENR